MTKKTLRPWESYEEDIHVPGNLFAKDLHFLITTRSLGQKISTQKTEQISPALTEEELILSSLEKAKQFLDNEIS